MSISSDGQVCYGVLLDGDQELPWCKEEYDNDFECWWIEGVCGYVPPFLLYDSGGEYINPDDKHDREKIGRYFRHRREFEGRHPCPVSLVNYCSYDYPMYIVVVGEVLRAGRGYPKQFELAGLRVSEGDRLALLAFCCEHGLEYGGEPGWWLSSLYG